MTTDATWSWTILMAKGKVYHIDKSISLYDLLKRYSMDGYSETEIEAIIRH